MWRLEPSDSHGSRTLVALDDQDDDGQPLARLELLQPDEYGLSVMWHNDKWQRIPVCGRLEKVVEVLRLEFGALLAPP